MCPHERVYRDRWDPGCLRCVRALHTLLTMEGPRIDNMRWFVIDCLRWGITFTDIEGWSFEEYDQLVDWKGFKNEPFTKWYQNEPPHWRQR